MRINRPRLRPWLISASSLASLALSCCNTPITVKDGTTCAASGLVDNGGICTHLISPDTFTLTYAEILDLLEAHPSARTCVPVGHTDASLNPPMFVMDLPVCASDQSTGTPVVLPPRGASIIMTSSDWGQEKMELDEACRDLGKSCTLDDAAKIQGMGRILDQ